MAVYIKQSPPREGVRGGWEDFNWESLKSQSSADRDYYLGASAKVGICTRGKFEKFDWWTKKKESGGPEGAADEELRKVKLFEHQLLEEALGRRPLRLLAGEALPDEEPPAPTAAPENVPDAGKTLKKLKKEHKRLKKLRKKEQKHEARRLRMLKRERRSGSPSPASSRSSSESRRRNKIHSRRHHRSRSLSCTSHRGDTSSAFSQVKMGVSEESQRSYMGGHVCGQAKREGYEEPREADSRKRRHSRSPERDRGKRRHRSRSVERKGQTDEADHHKDRCFPEGHRRERPRRRSTEKDRGGKFSIERNDRMRSGQKTDSSASAIPGRDTLAHSSCNAPTAIWETGERREVKMEFVKKERDTEPRRKCRLSKDTRDARRD